MPKKGIRLTSKDKAGEFQDDTFMRLEDEFTQIRSCIGMYISQRNTEGALHLFKEIFNNALDECTNKNSPSRKMYVTFNEEERSFVIADEGRGIPVDLLIDIVKTKHFGTKFRIEENKIKNKRVTGLNGVGLTVTAALTDYLSITSFRNDHAKSIEFLDGELKEHPVQKLTQNAHGLTVKFIPSEKYLGEIHLTVEYVEDFLRHLSYILPTEVKIYVELLKSKDDAPIQRVYTRQGLPANVTFLSSTLEFDPIEIAVSNDQFDLQVAFSYDKTVDDLLVESYANFVITTEGGTHETAAQRAICEFFSREARKLEPNNKYEITYDDCRKGLVMAVNMDHVEPGFEGQHKTRISNRDVLSIGKKGLMEALSAYFGSNQNTLRKIVSYLRQIVKVRLEATKIKGISTKKESTFLEDSAIAGFWNVADRKYSGYRELYIVEGDSAAGGLYRNPLNQAVYGIRGVTDNVYGASVGILATDKQGKGEMRVFKNIINILGCGVGKDFDINKLRFNKIIICTDSDTDGSNITSFLLCFFYTLLRPLLEGGYIYKAMPPLYTLDKKMSDRLGVKNEWVYDKNEYYEMKNKIISKNTDLVLESIEEGVDHPTLIPLSKKDAPKWLMMNAEYLLELSNLGRRAGTDAAVAEYAAYYKLVTVGDEREFKRLIEAQFPEMTYSIDTQSLIGSWNGQFFSLICDALFVKSARRFMNLLSQNPSLFVHVKNRNDSEDVPQRMTIGEFLGSMEPKYAIKTEHRIKGLGQADPMLLFRAVMNPKTRKLLRISMEDAKKADDMFRLLHGKNNAKARRDMLRDYDISYADIDN